MLAGKRVETGVPAGPVRAIDRKRAAGIDLSALLQRVKVRFQVFRTYLTAVVDCRYPALSSCRNTHGFVRIRGH
jgi:hypothetical protein